MVIHRSRCGEGEEAPSTSSTGCMWETPPRGEPGQGTTAAWSCHTGSRKGRGARRTCPSLPGGGSKCLFPPRAPPRPRPPVPLLNHLLLATLGRATPEDKAAGWHAPCRNNQNLPAGPAFGHSSLTPTGVPRRLAHAARVTPIADSRGPSNPVQQRRATPLSAKLHKETVVPRGYRAERQTFYFTFLVCVSGTRVTLPSPGPREGAGCVPQPPLPFCSNGAQAKQLTPRTGGRPSPAPLLADVCREWGTLPFPPSLPPFSDSSGGS